MGKAENSSVRQAIFDICLGVKVLPDLLENEILRDRYGKNSLFTNVSNGVVQSFLLADQPDILRDTLGSSEAALIRSLGQQLSGLIDLVQKAEYAGYYEDLIQSFPEHSSSVSSDLREGYRKFRLEWWERPEIRKFLQSCKEIERFLKGLVGTLKTGTERGNAAGRLWLLVAGGKEARHPLKLLEANEHLKLEIERLLKGNHSEVIDRIFDHIKSVDSSHAPEEDIWLVVHALRADLIKACDGGRRPKISKQELEILRNGKLIYDIDGGVLVAGRNLNICKFLSSTERQFISALAHNRFNEGDVGLKDDVRYFGASIESIRTTLGRKLKAGVNRIILNERKAGYFLHPDVEIVHGKRPVLHQDLDGVQSSAKDRRAKRQRHPKSD